MTVNRYVQGVQKQIVSTDFFTPWHDNKLLQQQASTSLHIGIKDQITSTITHANTNTIASTIKNTKKSINARIMKGVNHK